MSRQSAHGREAAEAWVVRRDTHLEAHPYCEGPNLGLPEKCWGPLDANHIIPRGMGGTHFDDSPLVSLCRRHHEWAEMHRVEAKALGLLV